MVIQNGRHNQRPVQNAGHQNCVLQLHKLVAEAAVGSVPEELFSSEGGGGAFWGIGNSGLEQGIGTEREEEVEEEEEKGKEEGEVEEWGPL